LGELFWCARSGGRGWSYTAPLVAPFLTVILSLFASVLAVIAPFFTPVLPVFAPVFAAFHPRGLSRSLPRCQHYDRHGDAHQRKRLSTRNQLFTHVYLPNNVSYPQLQQWCGSIFLVLRLPPSCRSQANFLPLDILDVDLDQAKPVTGWHAPITICAR
jgi:hypothetical protein